MSFNDPNDVESVTQVPAATQPATPSTSPGPSPYTYVPDPALNNPNPPSAVNLAVTPPAATTSTSPGPSPYVYVPDPSVNNPNPPLAVNQGVTPPVATPSGNPGPGVGPTPAAPIQTPPAARPASLQLVPPTPAATQVPSLLAPAALIGITQVSSLQVQATGTMQNISNMVPQP